MGGDGWSSTGADLLDGKGWVMFTEGIGYDPLDMSGRDYTAWADAGLGIIIRLNNGYAPNGTIPLPEYYGDFAMRCGHYVAASRGCNIWIVGNEPNLSIERPAPNMVILPESYGECYAACRNAIHAAQPDAQVLFAAIGPWNIESGDWIEYLQRAIVAAGQVDGYALHTYTHGHDPALVTSEQMMDPPFEDRHYQFRTYRDFLSVLPDGVPLYITETDQGGPWVDTNSGWVRAAYAEIDEWNQNHPAQVVRCLALYRWMHDEYRFRDKAGVQADLMQAMEYEYKWTEGEPPVSEWNTVYVNHCDDYAMWGEPPQVKVLAGYTIGWAAGTPRPEMDYKESPQQEVYPADPPRSGVGFLPFAAFDWWMRTEQPITVSAGVATKLTVPVMIVAHGIGGDNSKLGDCGMQVGIGPASATSLNSPDIVWSEWKTVRDPSQPGANMTEYVWAVAETPEIVPSVGQVHIWIRCVANVAADISAGHFDLIQVQQRTDVQPPPVDGDYRVVVYGPDGAVVAETSFAGSPSVNPQICGLAQQIVALSCVT